jgi:hypothetical protein
MTVTLVSSVGLHGANQPEDVHKVHRLLNRILRHLGTSQPAERLESRYGSATRSLIPVKYRSCLLG